MTTAMLVLKSHPQRDDHHTVMTVSTAPPQRTSSRSLGGFTLLETVVLILWKRLGLGDHLYELAPGFLLNSTIIVVVNRILPQDNPTVLRQFEEMVGAARQAGTAGPSPAYDSL